MSTATDDRPHVLIVGGGFGGLAVVRRLARAPVRVTILDRTNHHLFQPLLYQVAMAGLSPAQIAAPIRAVVRKQKNTSVYLAEVTGVDLDRKTVSVRASDLRYSEIPYDHLVLAVGARTSWFGNDHWAEHAFGLKSMEDALAVRRRVLGAFERAERERDSQARREWLTFVVVGGGPTGVELAGALAEISRHVLARDFREIRPDAARVLLIEGMDRVLGTFSEPLPESARKTLERLGVEVRLGTNVSSIDADGVVLGEERIVARTVLWAAGVAASPLTAGLDVPKDRAGRVRVEPDLSLPGHPEVFAVGDVVSLDGEDGKPLPGLAPVAMQQGKHVGKILAGKERSPFRYRDKGSMATIGRKAAIAEVGKIQLSGFPAWIAWLCIHLVFLIGFRNRLLVLFEWTWNYFTYGRGARIITESEAERPVDVRDEPARDASKRTEDGRDRAG